MLHQKIEPKKCLACGETIKGRSDKKFCDDYCRNNYNNQQKSSINSPHVRIINNVLAKNRRILDGLLTSEKETIKISREQLLFKGFSFMYFTHMYNNKKGNTYFFCYEYGYLPLENDWFLVVKRKEE